jgi:acetolactate synthase small subunit
MVKGGRGNMETIENIAEELVDLWSMNDLKDGNRVQRGERRKLAERIAEALQEERERCAKIADEYGRTVGDSVARKIREGGA